MSDAAPYVPKRRDLGSLRSASEDCQGCDLYRDATQTVFGAGPHSAQVMMVGEQPGDREDQEGKPFVGPAGALLDKAIQDSGFDRRAIYVTNAVKHFRFKMAERGKRRIHQKPSRGQIVACRPWLLAEISAVKPKLIVVLGATAAQSLLGTSFKITEQRGRPTTTSEELIGHEITAVATVHPSAVLRAPDRPASYEAFVADLRIAAANIG